MSFWDSVFTDTVHISLFQRSDRGDLLVHHLFLAPRGLGKGQSSKIL